MEGSGIREVFLEEVVSKPKPKDKEASAGGRKDREKAWEREPLRG